MPKVLKKELSEKFNNTKLSDPKTKKFIGSILRKEFDHKDTSYHRASDILAVAYLLDVPQFEEMLFDYDFENFNL